nr:MAG TPA: hypothetical protein [Caudoviricetes sp.]
MPLCFSGGERDDGFLRKNNSGIPGIHPDSERSDRKRKNVKSVISIIIHRLKFQLQKDCNRYIKTAVDHPTKDSIYRSLLKDIIS